MTVERFTMVCRFCTRGVDADFPARVCEDCGRPMTLAGSYLVVELKPGGQTPTPERGRR